MAGSTTRTRTYAAYLQEMLAAGPLAVPRSWLAIMSAWQADLLSHALNTGRRAGADLDGDLLVPLQPQQQANAR
jgi:hypothetical protein